MKTIYLAGGCFWGVQKFIDQFEGIISTEVGYANGEKPNPTYEEVCNDSGHVETVKVNYDEQVINTQELMTISLYCERNNRIPVFLSRRERDMME